MSELNSNSIIATGEEGSIAIKAPITEVKVHPDLDRLMIDFHSEDGGAIIELSVEMAQKLIEAIKLAIPEVGKEVDEVELEKAIEEGFKNGTLP